PSSPGGQASSGELALQVKGYIVPVHQILVSPLVGGILEDLDPNFEEGARFEKGQLIGRIQDKEFRYDYERAKANLAAAKERLKELKNDRPEEIDQARAELAETESNLRQLKLALDRTVKLAGTSAAASQDYEQAQYSFNAMEARRNRLQAALKIMTEGPR